MSKITVDSLVFSDGTPWWGLFHAQDQKASGTDGGDSVASTWTTRDINTAVTNEIGGSLSGDEVTLPAGTYYIDASAPAQNSNRSKIRLYDKTNSPVLLYGTAEQSSSSIQHRSYVTGKITLASPTTLRIDHYVTTNNTGNGFGANTGDGSIEIYTDFKAWRVG